MTQEVTTREQTVVRTSVVGIVANVLLAAFKAVVGIAANSIAITLDAVNNLSDALSSVITIVGTKLAAKPADKEHPLGYGRIEYLSATIISIIVLYAGVTSLVEGVKAILSPETPDYSVVALVIVAAAVVVKLLLGRYVKAVGTRVNSDSLVASGSDALFDAALSTSTLAAALIYLVWGVSLEAWVGTAISVVIVKSGLEMLGDTLSQILGQRIDAETAATVRQATKSVSGVLGVYDLVFHSYGPERLIGSLHVEVPDTTDAEAIDEMTRAIQEAVLQATDCKVIVAAVGIYSRNTTNDLARTTRNAVTRMVMAHEGVIQMHGFHLDEARSLMSFDVIIDFAVADRQAEFDRIVEEVRAAYPQYAVRATLDTDVSD